MFNLLKIQLRLTRDSFIKFIYRYCIPFSAWWYSLTMKLTRMPSKRVGYYGSTTAILNDMGWGRRYKKDPLNGKLDYLAHPSRLAHNAALELKFGDCDDHAIFWCVSLLKNDLADRAWFCFYSMEKIETGKTSAHAMCVFEKDDMFYWTDYNLPAYLDEFRNKAFEQSAKAYGATLIAAAMIEVKEVLADDTPVFGEITVLGA